MNTIACEFARRKSMKKTMSLAVGILCLLFVLINGSLHALDLNLELPDLSGNRVRFSEFSGKWILVHFWAPWCVECIEEFPLLDALKKEHPDLAVVGIAVMYRNRNQIQEFIKQHPVSFPVLLGTENTAAKFGGFDGLPASILFSPDGNLILKKEGRMSQGDVEEAMKTNVPHPR